MALTRCFALALTAMMLLCAAVNAAEERTVDRLPTRPTGWPTLPTRPTWPTIGIAIGPRPIALLPHAIPVIDVIRERDEASRKSAEGSTSYHDPEANAQLQKEMEGSTEDKDDTVSLKGVTNTYSVRKPRVWTDGDCCCPTIPRYYALQRFKRFGIWWYPLNITGNRQWYTVGKCQSFGTCHVDKSNCRWTDKKCVQQIEWKGFFVYRLSPFQVRYMMLPIPDYCSCPHCSKSCKPYSFTDLLPVMSAGRAYQRGVWVPAN